MNTLATLLEKLRLRLNDADGGNYTNEELKTCINLAVHETEIASKCHKTLVEVELKDGKHTYDTGLIFEPIEVSLGHTPLKRVELGEMGISLLDWNITPSGAPTHWMQMTGSSVRLYPTPDSAVTDSLLIYGFAVSEDLEDDNHQPTTIPTALADTLILDRAEAEARKMRATIPHNSALMTALMESWRGWIALLKESLACYHSR